MYDNKQIISRIISEDSFAPEIGDTFIHTFEPGCKIGPDKHDTVEVISVISGSSYMVINNQYVKIQKNECLILFPDIYHSFILENNQTCRLINVHFKQGDISSFFDASDLKKEVRFFYELKTNEMTYLKLVDNTKIRNISERIIKEAANRNKFSDILLRLYFCEMYIQLSNIIEDTCQIFTKPLSGYVCKALEYIQSCYSERITLKQVSEYTGVSPRHLSRVFNTHLNASVQDYINSLRIKNAKRMLEDSDRSITDIAYNLGFGNSQYFSTCFKKHEGITPKEYRKIVHNSNIF